MKGLGAAALLVAAIVVALAGCGSEKAPARQGGATAHGASAEVASLLAGIPQHGRTLGDPRAPVVVQFFGDLECPFCKRFALGALNSLINDYVRSGRLRIEYRSLQTATHDLQTFETQQTAALAAGLQNRMWNFIELFYHEQQEENSGYVTESYLQRLAQQVSELNLIAWTVARDDPRLADTLRSDARGAAEADISRTPGFRFGEERPVPYLPAIRKLLKE